MKRFASVLTVLGLLAGAGRSNPALAKRSDPSTEVVWRAGADGDFAATPGPAACVVAVKLPSSGPSPADVVDGVPDQGRGCLRRSQGRCRLERQAILVSTRIREKYRSFRESLTSP